MSGYEPATEHRAELAERPAGCLRLVARVAEGWDDEWETMEGEGRLRGD